LNIIRALSADNGGCVEDCIRFFRQALKLAHTKPFLATSNNPLHFEESHLLAKLKKAVICARLFESQDEKRSVLVRVAAFDLDDCSVYEQVRRDYEETRSCITNRGFEHLTGAMGVLVQPRTKGAGHGSTSRAFYARTQFVAKLLGYNKNGLTRRCT